MIRILLIAAVGTLVYRHFDSLWPRLRSMVGSSLSNRARISAHGNSAIVWSFSADSTRAVLKRGRAREIDWCDALNHLQSGLCNESRGVMEKARWLQAMNKPGLSRAEVHILKNESGSGDTVLTALEGVDGGSGFRYQRPDPSAPWCDSARGCLSSAQPRVPLTRGRAADAATEEPVVRWTSSTSDVFPALPGRVARLDSLGPGKLRIVLYHGRELYSTYEALRSFAGHLKIGDRVMPFKSIGMAAPADSSAAPQDSYAMEFRVEQAGMPLDPMTFFPVEAVKSNAP